MTVFLALTGALLLPLLVCYLGLLGGMISLVVTYRKIDKRIDQ